MRLPLGILVASFACMPVSGCKRSITPGKLAECSRKMSVVFPKGTRAIRIEESHGMDDSIMLKVEIAKGGRKMLLQQSPFANMVLSSTVKAIHVTSDPERWDVDTVKSFMSGETQLQDSSYLRILIDLDDPSKDIVYLEWFET